MQELGLLSCLEDWHQHYEELGLYVNYLFDNSIFIINHILGFSCNYLFYAIIFYFQAVVSVACLLSFFYIVVISWAIWYLVASFSLTLQWSNCENVFNSIKCFSPMKEDQCLQEHGNETNYCQQKVYDNFLEICKEKYFSSYNPSSGSCRNSTNSSEEIVTRTTSAEEYWDNYVLGHVGYNWDDYVRLC